MNSKNTTAPPSAQYLEQKPECLYDKDLECIFAPIWFRLRVINDEGSVLVSAPIPQKALAVELFEMLAPRFAGCKFRIYEMGGITREIVDFSKIMNEHMSLLVRCREDEHPADAYLQAVGFAPQEVRHGS